MKPVKKDIDFPINKDLLVEATKIKEEWKLLKERVKKIEEHKDQVSPAVYKKVLSDYKARVNEIQAIVLEKKKTVDKELTALYETQKKLTGQLEEHKHNLEELKFRNLLGEFAEQEYQNQSKEVDEKINKFETILKAVKNNITRYENLFSDENDLLESEEEEHTENFEHQQKDDEENEPEEDEYEEEFEPEEGDEEEQDEQAIDQETGEFIAEIENDNYFTSGKETTSTEKVKAKKAPEFEKTLPGQSQSLTNARVVIISGDDAGATYPLTDVVSFGRAETNTIVLRDAKVSRQHAKIVQKGKDFILMDLNSSNGTYVNDERIDEHVLTNNDEFQIGDSTLQFQT